VKENLKVVLNNLKAERSSLESGKNGAEAQLGTLNQLRRLAAGRIIEEYYLPDSDLATIKALREAIPGFPVPMASKWFGFSEKLDPNVSLDALRIQLGTFLDNAEEVPERWSKEVGRFDRKIRELQENVITKYAENLADISAKIAALEKLEKVDPKKINPEMMEKIKTALEFQKKNPDSIRRYPYKKSSPASYPTRDEIHSDSGPGLLDVWLWSQLLGSDTDHTGEAAESFNPGGGEFSGGGASGDWKEDGSPATVQGGDNQAPDIVSSSSEGQSVATMIPVPDEIENHMDLGAGNFS